MARISSWGRFVKRSADIAASSLLLVVFAVPLGLVGLLVAQKLGRPVFFRQTRPGQDGRPFSMVKFRTMRNAIGPDGQTLPDEERMTAFGSRLRSLSLDELPELWNVLRGDMSMVGPRPLLMQYLDRYTPEQARRHEMKPGITGWAQVNGRNAVGWDERFRMDVWYVDNWSLWLDLKILWLTVMTVLKRSGVSAEGHATMPEFRGSEPQSE